MKNNSGTGLSLWGVIGKTDKAIFDEFYQQYLDVLVFFAVKLIDDRFPAEDIVTDSFVKVWDRRHQFTNHAAVFAFLKVTVRNACLNHNRSVFRQKKRTGELQDWLALSGEDGAEAIALEAEVVNEIYKEIDNLPKKCREVFKLSYIAELENHEIAKILQITEGTVRNQKKRALGILRSKLSKDGFLILWISVISFDNQFVNFYSN